ncbi:hypothetical protein V2A60_009281 [Cordyceps javanica]
MTSIRALTESPKHEIKKLPMPENPCRGSSRVHGILAPRPYEDIYTEQAYLSKLLHERAQRIDGIITEYSAAQVQLNRGAKGKIRRRLRKLQSLLRRKLDEVSGQQSAILSRMGEVYIEQSSRDAWERVRAIPVCMIRDVIPTESADEECSVAQSTPCPSFTLSDYSASSSAAPVPPVYTVEPVDTYAGIPPYHDQHVAPQCPPPEYLETVPEEADEAVQAPASRQEQAGEDEGAGRCESCKGEPEIGTLEYSYVQCETPEEADEGSESDHDETDGETPSKIRLNRFSLPVMQFTWPDV